MASPIFTTDEPRPCAGRVIDQPDFAESRAARRTMLGEPKMPRNLGKRRTGSKPALLSAIERSGGRW